MRKISTLMVSVLCMMMPVGAEAQVPTAFVSKGATDIQAQPHSVTQTNSVHNWLLSTLWCALSRWMMDCRVMLCVAWFKVQRDTCGLVQTTDCAVLTDTMSKPIIIPLRL